VHVRVSSCACVAVHAARVIWMSSSPSRCNPSCNYSTQGRFSDSLDAVVGCCRMRIRMLRGSLNRRFTSTSQVMISLSALVFVIHSFVTHPRCRLSGRRLRPKVSFVGIAIGEPSSK
jgi:hypothetical protein